jgi:hypothetical protein
LAFFFTIDKTDISHYLWDQFEALDPVPMLLGGLKTLVRVAIREPQPLVQWVRSRRPKSLSGLR